MKTWILSTVAAGLVLYFGGFLIYGLLLMDVLANDAMKDPPVMWAIPAAQLLGGGVVATTLSWRDSADFMDGAKAAAAVALLISLCYGLMTYASLDIGTTFTQIGIDAVGTVVLWGLAGGVVGKVRGRA